MNKIDYFIMELNLVDAVNEAVGNESSAEVKTQTTETPVTTDQEVESATTEVVEKTEHPVEQSAEKALAIDEAEEEDEVVNQLATQTFKTPNEKVEATKSEIPKEIQEEFSAAQAKAKQYDDLINDPELAWAVLQKKEGKSIFEAFSEVQVMDVSKLTPEQIYQHHLNTIKSKDPSITEDDVLAEMEEFNSLSNIKKSEAVSAIRAQLEKENQEKKSLFSVDPNKVKQMEADLIAQSEEINSEIQSEKVSVLDSLKGRTIYGVNVDDRILKEINDYLDNDVEPMFTIENGIVRPNVAAIAELAFHRTQVKKIISVAKNGASTDAKLAILKERQRANANPGTSSPQSLGGAGTETQRMEDEVVQIMRNQLT